MVEKKNNRRENRESNTRQVFNLILNSEEGISRIDISKKTGLSASVITGIADKLISQKLVIESGVIEKKDAGRRAILLKTNPFGGFFASLLFESKRIKLEVFDLERNLDASYTVPITKEVVTGEFLINAIEDAVQYNYKYGTFFGIILILPPWHGSAYCDERMLEEFGYRFAHDYKSKLCAFYKDVRVFTEPTTALVAYSKVDLRAESKNILCIEAGSDIYSSFILNGRLFDRKHCTDKFANAIVNHNLIDSGKARLKDYISQEAICSAYREKTGRNVTFDDVVKLYLSGDPMAIGLIVEMADIFAQCVAGLAQLLELDYVIIGGDIARLGEEFRDLFMNHLIMIETSLQTVEVLLSREYELSTLGGAHFAFDHVFSN